MRDFKYVEPALVRVLVTPVGSIGKVFETHLSTFQTATNIRLVDVSPIPQSRFNPQQNSQGKVFLLFITNYNDAETSFLTDFEPFRRTFIVLGLGLHNDYTPDAIDDLRAKFPAAITHHCVFYQSPNTAKPSKGCFFMSQEAEHVITSIETILCDVVHSFLVSLNDYSSSYENITLRSPVLSIDGTALTRSINQAQKRLSTSLKGSFSSGPGSVNKGDLRIKSLQKQSGRQAKIMANFYLLAGCLNDAVQYFTDAAINTRKSDDYLWLASALDGLSVSLLLIQLLGLQTPAPNPMLYTALQLPKERKTTMPTSVNRTSSDSVMSRQSGNLPSPRPSISGRVSLSTVVSLNFTSDFNKYPPLELLLLLCLRTSHYYQLSSLELEDCVPDIVYLEYLLRSIDFMQTVHLVGGDDVGRITKEILSDETTPDIIRHEPTTVTKEFIAFEIYQVFSLEIHKMAPSQIFRVYSKIANVYQNLGLERRKGFVLRQYLDALLSHTKAVTPGNELDPTLGAEIHTIVNQIIPIYKLCDDICLKGASSSNWSVLQLQILQRCLQITELIQDFDLASKIGVLLLSRYLNCLSNDEQRKLKHDVGFFILNLQSDKPKMNIPYPDPFLIRTVSLINETRESLAPFPAISSIDKADEFVFNPFAKKVSTAIDMTKVICVNEMHSLILAFQNPFLFDINIVTIEAITANGFKMEINRESARVVGSEFNNDISNRANMWREAPFISDNSQLFENGGSRDPLTIPSKSITTVEFQMRPLQTGDLAIEKFLVGVDQFSPQPFYVICKELYPPSSKIKFLENKPTSQGFEQLDSFIENLASGQCNKRISNESFELNVIPSQPLLLLMESLINSGCIMLLEGEKQHGHLLLRNPSSETINYLSFSFWDTSLETITSVLAARDPKTGAEDVYELEWQLVKKKALVITNKDEIAAKHSKIEPTEEMKIEFDIFGKRAVKEIRLMLEYGIKNEEDLSRGFIKTMQVPIKVSVQRSVEVVTCDVMPLLPKSIQELPSSTSSQGFASDHIKNLLEFLSKLKGQRNEAKNFCLLVLDLRNKWRDRLRIDVRFQVTKDQELHIQEIIDPEHNSRLLIPVRRAENIMEHYSKPIPSLQNRQFIKNTEIPEEQQAQERLSYWLRSSLLLNLSGRWSTVGCDMQRSGEIDMRRIRLTPSLISALVQESILMQHVITLDDDHKPVQKSVDDQYELTCGRFYTICTHITNNSSKQVYGTLRYVPFPVHASTKQDLCIEKRILYNGVLQKSTGARAIEPGQSFTMKLGFLVVEKGLYEWGTVFDQGCNDPGVIDRDPLYIVAN